MANVSLEMDLVASIRREDFSRSMLLSSILAIFTAREQLRPYYNSRLTIWRHIWIQSNHFAIKTLSLQARDTDFGGFCGDNVCAKVRMRSSALISLPVVNLSLKVDSATSISYTTWKL